MRCVSGLALLAALTPACKQSTPSPEALVARFVEITGGRQALEERVNAVGRGHVSIPTHGLEGEYFTYLKMHYTFTEIRVPAVGTIVNAFDGKTAWTQPPGGPPQRLEPLQAEAMAISSDVHMDLHIGDLFPERRTVGPVDFKGIRAWQAQLTTPTGNVHNHYFDVASGLRVGFDIPSSHESVPFTSTTELKDYKALGSLKFPMRHVVTGGPAGEIRIEFEAMDFNIDPFPVMKTFEEISQR